MYFYEYMDNEIPNWKNDLGIEYVEKVKEAFMNVYNREAEIKLLKELNEKTPCEYYQKMINERQRNLEKHETNLKIVTKYAKQHLNESETVYDYAYEALKRIKEYREKYEDTTELTENEHKLMQMELENNINHIEERGKKL